MSVVRQQLPHQWEVYLGSELESEVTVVVHMSHQQANTLVASAAAQLRRQNPGRIDIPTQTPGSAILNILSAQKPPD